jgi:hypothetical protein
MLTQSCEMIPGALEEMVWLPEVQSSAYSHQTSHLFSLKMAKGSHGHWPSICYPKWPLRCKQNRRYSRPATHS